MTAANRLTFTEMLDALREWVDRPATIEILRADDNGLLAAFAGQMQEPEGAYDLAAQLEHDGDVLVRFTIHGSGFYAGDVVFRPETFHGAERRGPDELVIFDADRAVVLSVP